MRSKREAIIQIQRQASGIRPRLFYPFLIRTLTWGQSETWRRLRGYLEGELKWMHTVKSLLFQAKINTCSLLWKVGTLFSFVVFSSFRFTTCYHSWDIHTWSLHEGAGETKAMVKHSGTDCLLRLLCLLPCLACKLAVNSVNGSI